MNHLSTQTYRAGAHGLRRIPGQSVNLAHLFGAHHAPRPPFTVTPGGFPRGAIGVGVKPLGVPALRFAAARVTPLGERRILSITPKPQAMPSQGRVRVRAGTIIRRLQGQHRVPFSL
jgi:hypothetical protein